MNQCSTQPITKHLGVNEPTSVAIYKCGYTVTLIFIFNPISDY